MAGTKRRSMRQAATRRRSIYIDPETDDDFEVESDTNGEVDLPPELDAAPPRKKRKATVTRHKPQTRSKVRSKAKSMQKTTTVRSIFKVGKPRKANSKDVSEQTQKEFSGLSDHKIPDWTALPLDILRDIFIYASQPLKESTNRVSWLLRAARTCRTFSLPALEAYYQSPALPTSLHPHHFLDLLRMPNEVRFIDYNVKVRTLELPVRTLAYVAHNKPPFDVSHLVAELPQLQHLEILHPKYLPPYRYHKVQRWTYPPSELFDAMDQRKIRLKSWRWSRDLIPKNTFLDLYSSMAQAHERPAFSRLKRLVVCGYNYEDSSEPGVHEPGSSLEGNDAASLPPGLATSICKLPELQDLTFVSCDIIMDKFLQRLPSNLQRLELSNCLEITSDMMRAFFKTSALNLRELVLNHNAALNLSFLTGLKVLCPRLQVLDMNLHYYSEKVTVNDAEAFYDKLLSEDEIPTWPRSLRFLSIVHAQKWSTDAAQNLFSSLIDSASELPDLRHLVLHTHINIPWRDRVGFRDQWIERLKRVFLRKIEEPSPHLGSLRQFRIWRQSHGRDELGWDHSDSDVTFTRKLSHVQISPHKQTGDTEVYSDSDIQSGKLHQRQPRRSQRVAVTQVSQVSKSATESSESESEDEIDEDDWRSRREKFVQGLCEVVDISIDNQRPSENQFTEGDFLDSEASGDEDWQEGADSEPEDSHAW